MFKATIISILLILWGGNAVKAWDSEEMEIFDLVEELKEESFYNILGVNEDATLAEIKRAFRNLSIVLHPDKNPDPNANVVFRNLVSVYETLKDAGKREKYNKVLKEGLPNWKSALYYYRKARKVGIAEMCAILFVLITIGQYFTSWAVYLEKKYTMEQLFSKNRKKKNIDVDAILKEIPYPSIKNTLPFQIPIGLYRAVIGTPSAVKDSINLVQEFTKRELEKKQKEKEEEELLKKLEEERQREKEERKKGLRQRKANKVLPEKTEEELAAYSATIIKNKGSHTEEVKVPISGGVWTDDDLEELIRLTKKYPPGTVDRWEVISGVMNRNVSEVTLMAYKVKNSVYRIPGETEKLVENITKKLKTKKPDVDVTTEAQKVWSQEQQKALEAAIQKYPKSIADDRWQKIANSVPGKTKEECLLRYKYLVELVKKQKEEEERKKQEEEEERKRQEENLDNEKENEEKSQEAQSVESTRQAQKPNKKNKKKKQESQIEDSEQLEEEETATVSQQKGGKKKNKRKEAKKNIDYYYEDSEEEEEESE